MPRRLLLPVCAFFLLPLFGGSWMQTAAAQPTNEAVFSGLAAECLPPLPDAAGGIRLRAPDAMPFVRSAIVNAWKGEGRSVYVEDSLFAQPYPAFSYSVSDARVRYARAGRGKLQRTVDLELRYTLTGADGLVLNDAPCRKQWVDVVPLREAERLATAAYPETQAALPDAGWRRRYLEPSLLLGATALSVYLLFSLRSGQGNDGS